MSNHGYARILVPTDMSEFGNVAIRLAALLHERLGSRITLLYADETYFPIDVLEIPLGYYLERAPETKAALQTRLREFADSVIPGAGVETLVVQDTPSRAIAQAAQQIDASLVIMGTHGRRGWRRALLGSVTEVVLHEIDCPVITVTPALLAPGVPARIRTIVCPFNFSLIARESLQHASALAQAFDAELIMVYVAEGMEPPQIPEVEAAFNLWVAPAVRDRARYKLSLLTDRGGDPAERVLGVAQEVGADLIVIGAQHKFFSDATVIGTTTQRITRFARCPVMTVVRKAHPEKHVHLGTREQEEEEELTVV